MPIPFVAGKPITVWLGLVVFVLLLTTLSSGMARSGLLRPWTQRYKRLSRLPLKYHQYMALATLVAAFIHGGFAFVAYFL
jgi:hypothetical protein